MKQDNDSSQQLDGRVTQLRANQPYKPRKGLVPLPTAVLVAAACVVVVGVTLAGARVQSHQWQLLESGSDQLSPVELLQRASLAKESAQRGERFLRDAKRSAGIPPDPALWPTDSPWVGDELTPLTTTLGSLEAKRTSASPDWARVLTLKLHQAGVRQGSAVAAGCSGSFPALNLALACACQALGADLIAVSSVTASTWGANQPGFTWPEIESRLASAGIIRPVSVAVAMGGEADKALDLDPAARRLAQQIQQTSAAALGAGTFLPASLREAVDKRLEVYRHHARGRRIVLYVNVGGTEASLGTSSASFRLVSGFIAAKPFDISPTRGVIARFAEDGVPTLSLLHVEGLALRWRVKH